MAFPVLEPSGDCVLSALTLSPFIGILALMLLPIVSPGAKEKVSRVIGILSALLTFALSVLALKQFSVGSASLQLVESHPWIPSYGVNFTLGIDGISMPLTLLTTFLTVIVMVAAESVHKNIRAYLICMLLLEVGMVGTFLALDALSFYVFWELMLIPMYFLIGVWGGSNRIYAAIKFVLYTAAGSLLMLVAIVYLASSFYHQSGYFSFALSDWAGIKLTLKEELWLFAAFALAFSIKIPLFPFHTWLPDAHVEAPTGGSVILAGVLLKMGLYGLIRICVPIFPTAVIICAPLFAILGVVGIVYGALVAWVQTDMKKLVAYSSVSHLGFCVLGFAALNLQGLQGSLLQMLNHGVSTAALFLLVGVLYDRKHTRLIADYGGLAVKIPLFAAVYLVFTLSSIGLPLTNGFIGEFLIMLGGFAYRMELGAVAVTGVIFGAIYMLSLYRRVIFGAIDEAKNGDLLDLSLREKLIFAPLLVLVFYIGLYPNYLLKMMEPSARKTLSTVAAGGASAVSENQEGISGFGKLLHSRLEGFTQENKS